jgi:hypothetical protein
MNSIPTFTVFLICRKSNGVDAASIVAGQAPQTSKISSTGKDARTCRAGIVQQRSIN